MLLSLPALALAAPLGFSEGTAPLDLGPGGTAALDSGTCGACHLAEYADWAPSRHRASHSNPIYQAGLVAEPKAFCVYCHAPATAQAAEVLPNLRWYRSQDPRAPADAPVARAPEPLAAEGVTCAVCHYRSGEILAAKPSPEAPHPIRVVDDLGTELCRGCHEFRVPVFRDGALELTPEPMQATWSEWTAYRDAGGEGDCASCHLPGGRHTFAGAHDRAALRDAVRVDARHDGDELVLAIASVGVGHALPTGDLFRRITVEVDRGGWEVVATLGRTFAVSEVGGEPVKRLVADTSLRPGEVREVRTADGPWRLVFHYGSPTDEARGRLDAAALTTVLASSGP